MGLDGATVQLLLNGKTLGLSLERMLTIGRQTVALNATELGSLLRANGLQCSRTQAQALLDQDEGYCEPLLRMIGAGHVDSMDISSYEKATVLHDLNEPLAKEHHEKYSLVLDGGSLEHVFNFPTGLASCMQAVELGGHFVTVTPANNALGHGFYQFSPELMYRVLCADNGYEITRVLLYEMPWRGTWYQVQDPEEARSRIELVNHRPTYLIACAKRVAIKPLFEKTPQQSDYAAMWATGGKAKPHFLKRYLPPHVAVEIRSKRMGSYRRPFFKKLPARF